MSIWTDMIKYNAKNQKLVYDSNAEDFELMKQRVEFGNLESITEYTDLTSFTPKLSGEIQVYFQASKLEDGGNGNVNRVYVRILKGNELIFGDYLGGTVKSTSKIISVDAFNRYTIQYKNEYQADGWYETYLPYVVRYEYIVAPIADKIIIE